MGIDPTRLGQVAAGAAGLAGGYLLASDLVRTTYRDDLLGDPTRIVEMDDDTVIYQDRGQQGGRVAMIALGAGTVSAFAGGALLMGASPLAKLAGPVRGIAGVGLAAFGGAAIAGAAATSAQFDGTDFTRTR